MNTQLSRILYHHCTVKEKTYYEIRRPQTLCKFKFFTSTLTSHNKRTLFTSPSSKNNTRDLDIKRSREEYFADYLKEVHLSNQHTEQQTSQNPLPHPVSKSIYSYGTQNKLLEYIFTLEEPLQDLQDLISFAFTHADANLPRSRKVKNEPSTQTLTSENTTSTSTHDASAENHLISLIEKSIQFLNTKYNNNKHTKSNDDNNDNNNNNINNGGDDMNVNRDNDQMMTKKKKKKKFGIINNNNNSSNHNSDEQKNTNSQLAREFFEFSVEASFAYRRKYMKSSPRLADFFYNTAIAMNIKSPTCLQIVVNMLILSARNFPELSFFFFNKTLLLLDRLFVIEKKLRRSPSSPSPTNDLKSDENTQNPSSSPPPSSSSSFEAIVMKVEETLKREINEDNIDTILLQTIKSNQLPNRFHFTRVRNQPPSSSSSSSPQIRRSNVLFNTTIEHFIEYLMFVYAPIFHSQYSRKAQIHYFANNYNEYDHPLFQHYNDRSYIFYYDINTSARGVNNPALNKNHNDDNDEQHVEYIFDDVNHILRRLRKLALSTKFGDGDNEDDDDNNSNNNKWMKRTASPIIKLKNGKMKRKNELEKYSLDYNPHERVLQLLHRLMKYYSFSPSSKLIEEITKEIFSRKLHQFNQLMLKYIPSILNRVVNPSALSYYYLFYACNYPPHCPKKSLSLFKMTIDRNVSLSLQSLLQVMFCNIRVNSFSHIYSAYFSLLNSPIAIGMPKSKQKSFKNDYNFFTNSLKLQSMYSKLFHMCYKYKYLLNLNSVKFLISLLQEIENTQKNNSDMMNQGHTPYYYSHYYYKFNEARPSIFDYANVFQVAKYLGDTNSMLIISDKVRELGFTQSLSFFTVPEQSNSNQNINNNNERVRKSSIGNDHGGIEIEDEDDVNYY